MTTVQDQADLAAYGSRLSGPRKRKRYFSRDLDILRAINALLFQLAKDSSRLGEPFFTIYRKVFEQRENFKEWARERWHYAVAGTGLNRLYEKKKVGVLYKYWDEVEGLSSFPEKGVLTEEEKKERVGAHGSRRYFDCDSSLIRKVNQRLFYIGKLQMRFGEPFDLIHAEVRGVREQFKGWARDRWG